MTRRRQLPPLGRLADDTEGQSWRLRIGYTGLHGTGGRVRVDQVRDQRRRLVACRCRYGGFRGDDGSSERAQLSGRRFPWHSRRLTPEQRDAALAKSREAHQARKTLLAGVSSVAETIPAVLFRAQSDPIAGKTKVSRLVRALPGYGLTKTRAPLQETGIPEDRRAAGLGSRQREALSTALS